MPSVINRMTAPGSAGVRNGRRSQNAVAATAMSATRMPMRAMTVMRVRGMVLLHPTAARRAVFFVRYPVAECLARRLVRCDVWHCGCDAIVTLRLFVCGRRGAEDER